MEVKVLNYLGVEVTRPDQILRIMRGISGSGKSTRAKELVGNGVIHSTDELWEATGDYFGAFKRMNDTGDWSEHGKMHHKNFLNALASMKAGVSPVIIDNTNLRPNEAKKYVNAALELGFDDANILIEDVGTGGVSAEVLASRNTHGVPLETIQKMVAKHKGNGELTLKKIMESKDMNRRPKILYSGVILDEKSKGKLLTAFGYKIPDGWKEFAHHMTIAFKAGLPAEYKDDLGKIVNLTATHVGVSDTNVAVKIAGYASELELPHITLAVDTENGGKPAMSKEITNWVKLDSYIGLAGVVTEVKP
jgi:predicted kinase